MPSGGPLSCSTPPQVWEWRSETYVLKQQGHYYDVAASAFSPDGAYLVTGADDAKVGDGGQAGGHAVPSVCSRCLTTWGALSSHMRCCCLVSASLRY